jgi:hypothetical protein
MSSVLIVLAAVAGAVAGIRGVALVARGLRADAKHASSGAPQPPTGRAPGR